MLGWTLEHGGGPAEAAPAWPDLSMGVFLAQPSRTGDGMSTLFTRFERAAEAWPTARAVVDVDSTTTYGDLLDRTRRLATGLLDHGVRRGQRAAFALPKQADTIALMLAVNAVGATFVPLDPTAPVRRRHAMLDAAKPQIFVRENSLDLAAGGDTWPGPVVAIEDLISTGRTPSPDRTSNSTAYLLFTSGSTGLPKGVPISNRNVLAFVDWANAHFDVQPGDRHSAHAPLFFDLAMHDVFGSLSAGAEIHIASTEHDLLPATFVDVIADRGLTQWFSVPSVLRAVAGYDGLAGRDLPNLRRVLWCGEVLSTPTVHYWMRHLPGRRFTNLYGPTETTIASTYHDVLECPEPDAPPIPIGRPCAGETATVVGPDGDPAPIGSIGELHIGGVGLSDGYWQDPLRTDEAFVHTATERRYRTGDLARQDHDGVLHFEGRRDRQVKSRGHRIELDEIVAGLAMIDELDDVAVVALQSSGFDGTQIAATYVVNDEAEPLSPARLRQMLRGHLPSYMIPSRWLPVDTIPTTANGKIDHRAVAELFEPSTRTEVAR